jgi:hypothetical protein
MKTKIFSFSASGLDYRAPLVVAVMIAAPAALSDTLGSLSMGQDITYGGASHPRTVQSALHNPASPAASDRRGVWFGLGGASASYELGDVRGFEGRLNDIADALNQEFQGADVREKVENAQDTLNSVNAFTDELGQRGYANLQGRVQPPMMPLGAGLPGLGGQFSLGVEPMGNARVEFLNDPLCVNGPESEINTIRAATNRFDDLLCEDDLGGEVSLSSDSSAFIKGAAGTVASLGYSSEALFRRDGELILGTRLNRYDLELAKGVHKLANEDRSGESADIIDGLEDEFDRNTREASATGMDLGVLWKAHRYRLGATIYNVNEPSFAYPAIGNDCQALDGNAKSNCNAADELSGQLDNNETHTMEQQIELEAGVFSSDRTWSLTSTYDVSSAPDVLGNEQQWFSLTGSLSPRGWWIPGLRLGYQANQAGSELGYYTGGLTLFRLINIDAAVSRETVEVDGEEAPRSARVSLGLEVFF